MMKDVSILIVHYNTPGLLRQTLKGIRSAAPTVACETIVIDNNPHLRIAERVRKEFPEVRVVVSEKNLGFGGGMNLAMEHAQGRYFLVFNPDIALFPGAIEKLVAFMDSHPDVGIAGPRLANPDRSLQQSCYRFAPPSVILYRRIPWLRALPRARRAVENYLMAEWDHGEVRDVDYLLGAALMVRREAVAQVGKFDPAFFMYFEDQDWCRRFWKHGWRVVYCPQAQMIHYHRRETAEGGFWEQIRNPLTRIQLKSAWRYYRKYKGERNPREQKNAYV